jgi:hypothetical protein
MAVVHISDLDENTPVEATENIDGLDGHIRQIKSGLKQDFSRVHHNEDGSDKVMVDCRTNLGTHIPEPRNYNVFDDLSNGAVLVRVPATDGVTFTDGGITTTTGATVTKTGTANWDTNILAGMVLKINASGNTYTIKSVDSSSTLTLTSDLLAADENKTGVAYTIRLLAASDQWPKTLPIFAVARPDGSAGPINANGGLNTDYASILERCVVAYDNDLNVGAVTATVTLTSLPAKAIVENVYMVIDTQFVQAGITALQVEVGDDTDPDGLISDADIMTDAANTPLYDNTNGVGAYLKDASDHRVTKIFSVTATHDIKAKFTATGGNLSTLSAGQISIYIEYRTLPSRLFL